AFIPISRYFDRITRPEQIVPAALTAMRVLTSPADTGAVTLSLAQDVQAEAFDAPDEFLEKRVWHVARQIPDPVAMARLVEAIGAARVILETLVRVDHRVDDAYRRKVAELKAEWDRAVDAAYRRGNKPLPAQSEVIGAVNEATRPQDVVICAAGSLPGELHKLWRARDPKQYHVEYGYSCMGYEIPAGIGVKFAAPEREVFVMVGDG